MVILSYLLFVPNFFYKLSYLFSKYLGAIKSTGLYEALVLMVVLLKLIDNISFYYLPNNLQKILKIMILTVSLYTPLFKKIPLVKNLVCAFIVSFTLFFSGLSTNSYIINKSLLFIASIYILLGSLVNEILLDIYDYNGDYNGDYDHDHVDR